MPAPPPPPPTDKFGALPLDPVPTPTRAASQGSLIGALNAPAGDVLIFYVGEYLKTIINGDCGAAWAMLDPFDPTTQTPIGKLPVTGLEYVDPKDHSFNTRDLPGLFLYRTTFPMERIADAMWVQKSNLGVFWVPSPTNLQRRQERAPFVDAVGKAINRAIIRGRDPRWIVTGDTDTYAATLGSSLIGWAGVDRPIVMSESKRDVVIIEGSKQKDHDGEYTGLKVTLQTEERYKADPLLRESAGDLIATTAQTPYTVAGKNNIPKWFPGPVIPVVR